MGTESVVIALVLAFSRLSAASIRGVHYGVISNIIPDGTSTKSVVTTRSVLTCAIRCSTQSMADLCTIASYNKNTRQCTLSTSTSRDLVYYEGQDDVSMLFPQLGNCFF